MTLGSAVSELTRISPSTTTCNLTTNWKLNCKPAQYSPSNTCPMWPWQRWQRTSAAATQIKAECVQLNLQVLVAIRGWHRKELLCVLARCMTCYAFSAVTSCEADIRLSDT